MNTLPPVVEMQRAYRRSDASYDGVFFLAVRTTGIFCRPSCPAKKPLPRNVEYFAAAGEAMRAGYRACKRCRPMDTNGRPPEWARRLIERVQREPGGRMRDTDLRELAIDPARARRYFRRHYGMTFQAYQRSMRLGESLTQIRRGADVTDVALGHGYESMSGFREAFARTFGKPPGRARRDDCIVSRVLETPLGPLIAAATSRALCLAEFVDRRALETQFKVLRRRFACAVVPGRNAAMDQFERELSEYFAGTRRAFSVPIDFPGTPFQKLVWDALQRIPYGRTCSYEQLARAIGHPKACRAVGRANGENRLGIIIPCHRVVNANGELGGYGGGLWRKRALLDLEQRHAAPGLFDE